MKLPKAVTIKSAKTLRDERITRREEDRKAHNRMYEKLLQRRKVAK